MRVALKHFPCSLQLDTNKMFEMGKLSMQKFSGEQSAEGKQVEEGFLFEKILIEGKLNFKE